MNRHNLSMLLILLVLPQIRLDARPWNGVDKRAVQFASSDGVRLAGTLYVPPKSFAAVVMVHGSGQESRMGRFAELLAGNGISVLTYDKRGVGESGGIYAGPEVGTNNIDSANLNRLAEDARAAVLALRRFHQKLPIGILGFSQAGWIIPMAVNGNPLVSFMVLFSCPTITTLEQLRFQFYTAGRADFWDSHTDSEAREHMRHDADKYVFTATDPKAYLRNISIPGLWLFGEQDIQVPVKVCIEQINTLRAQGKPFEYALFPALGHSTAFATDATPVDISIQWIKEQALRLRSKSQRR